MNKFEIKNHNQEIKNFTIGFIERGETFQNIIIDELVLQNIAFHFAIIKSQKKFIINKMIKIIGKMGRIKGILAKKINSTIVAENIELNTVSNQTLFYPIINGSFEIEPIFISSYLSSDRTQQFQISRKEIYPKAIFGIVVFVLLALFSLKLIKVHCHFNK
jgi:hypothetical protein